MLDWVVVPDHPVVFTIEAPASIPVFLRLFDVVYQLPGLPGLGYRPRPPGLVPVPNSVTMFSRFESDTTLIRQLWRLTASDVTGATNTAETASESADSADTSKVN